MGLPRVWLAPLSKDWSYDFTARALRQHLSHRFEIRIAYERDEIPAWEADLYVDLWWGSNLQKRFGTRTLKQVSSHRWKQPRYHRLDVKRLVGKYLAGAGGVLVPSLRLLNELGEAKRQNMPHLALGPKGFHPELMGDYGRRRGELVVGWAGNASAADKHIEILHAAWPDARLADRCLVQSEMSDFYNSVDVITCMSKAEGDPRTLIEGMACGCFPVTVDVGIVPELVEHMANGFIVQERTPQAFAAALKWCSDNVELVREAGRRNAQQMLHTRTWAQAAAPWGDAFDAALARAADAPMSIADDFSRASRSLRDDLRARRLAARKTREDQA